MTADAPRLAVLRRRASRAGARARARGSRRSAADDEPTTTSTPRCRALVRALGAAGWLRYCVPAAYGGALDALDSRALCVLRETLAYHDGLADFAFAMQGLGSGAITLAGQPSAAGGAACRASRAARRSPRSRCRSRTRAPTSRAMRRARARDGDGWVLDGEQDLDLATAASPTSTACSRAPAKAAGARGISRVRRRCRRAGLDIAERIDVIAPHPLATPATSTAAACRATRCSASAGEGFKLAMRTLDIFRASVAAAALGFARRALDEALAHAQRAARCSASTLADLPADAGEARRHGDGDRRARRCSPTAPPGCATCKGAARRRARRRWPRWPPPNRRSR